MSDHSRKTEVPNAPMTLLDKWRLYMKNCPSPDLFIEMGFHYMIGSALQRRVWLGPPQEGMSIFPNMFVILCAEPGVGKGNVIKPVAKILKYHKLSGGDADAARQKNVAQMDEMIENAKKAGADEEILSNLYKSRDALTTTTALTSSTKKERLLIPVAADSTTYESLVNVHAGSVSKMTVAPCEKAPAGFYVHHSLCFALEEISSLFRKNQQAIVNYLIVAFDCGDYTYETKNSGTDRVRKCCLSFFGGTTPGFMKTMFDQSLLEEGFAARTLFVYGHEARMNHFQFPPFSDEQLIAEREIIERVKKLSTFFGQATFTDEAQEYCNNYFSNVLPKKKTNPMDVMKYYYSRKQIHVQKLCMAMHFADNDSYEITLETVMNVMNLLDKLELNMHHALAFTGRNPLGAIYRKVMKWIEKEGGANIMQIWTKFVDEMSMKEVEECLVFLQASDMIESDSSSGTMIYKTTGKKL